jgi:hypothetical protein
MYTLSMAGVQGFEPQSADPESAVLPLNDTPIEQAAYLQPAICEVYNTPTFARCQAVLSGDCPEVQSAKASARFSPLEITSRRLKPNQ